MIARRDDMRNLMISRCTTTCPDEPDGSIDPKATTDDKTKHALSSLDEEDQAADSDESGYVEASPKSSMDHAELKSHKVTEESNNNDAEFIKCPISETIKKLANASLRSSKAIKVSTGACLESLSVSSDTESPSLIQRKRLLAQHGVMV